MPRKKNSEKSVPESTEKAVAKDAETPAKVLPPAPVEVEEDEPQDQEILPPVPEPLEPEPTEVFSDWSKVCDMILNTGAIDTVHILTGRSGKTFSGGSGKFGVKRVTSREGGPARYELWFSPASKRKL